MRKYTILASALMINLVAGVLYAWSVLGKALEAQGWSKPEAALPFTAATVTFAVMMIFAGRLQDRFGPALAAAIGGVCIGAGLCAAGCAVTSPTVMPLCFGLITGTGVALCYAAVTPCAIKWFPPQQKGLVTGVVVAGVGLAAVYIAPLANWLLGKYGMAHTFWVLGIGALAVTVPLALSLRNPAAAAPAAGGARAALQGVDKTWQEMVKTGPFYMLWLMFAFSASAGLLLLAHLPQIAKAQAGWEKGFLLVVLIAVFNTAGRIVGGFLSDKLGRRAVMALIFVGQAVNMLCFAHYTSLPLLVLGVALAGIFYGAIYTVMPATTADLYGVKNLGVNFGLVFTAFGAAGIIGPMLKARLPEAQTAYYIAAGLLGVALVLSFFFRERAKPTA